MMSSPPTAGHHSTSRARIRKERDWGRPQFLRAMEECGGRITAQLRARQRIGSFRDSAEQEARE